MVITDVNNDSILDLAVNNDLQRTVEVFTGRGDGTRLHRLLLDDLSDDVSLEDIQYRLTVRSRIERGLRDVEAGRVVVQDEAKRCGWRSGSAAASARSRGVSTRTTPETFCLLGNQKSGTCSTSRKTH